jgi:hypothetical protein
VYAEPVDREGQAGTAVAMEAGIRIRDPGAGRMDEHPLCTGKKLALEEPDGAPIARGEVVARRRTRVGEVLEGAVVLEVGEEGDVRPLAHRPAGCDSSLSGVGWIVDLSLAAGVSASV